MSEKKKTNQTKASDIASLLGVSISTVSRALTGSRRTSESTRQRVIKAAKDLGYEKPDIRRHRRRAILVIALFLDYSKHEYHDLFYDPAELLAGIREGFRGVRVNVVTSFNEEDPEILDHKRLGDVDGAIFGFTTPKPKLVSQLEEFRIPAIVLNRKSRRFNYIVSDNLAGMTTLLERVIACRENVKPCYVGMAVRRPVPRYRESAFFGACKSLGIQVDATDVYRISQLEEIDGAFLETVLRRQYNAVICYTDVVAIYFYQVALAHGVAIPDRICLTGFDDIPARALTPQKIDTIALSPFNFGREAGAWLRESIISHTSSPLRKLLAGDYIQGETICGSDKRLRQNAQVDRS